MRLANDDALLNGLRQAGQQGARQRFSVTDISSSLRLAFCWNSMQSETKNGLLNEQSKMPDKTKSRHAISVHTAIHKDSQATSNSYYFIDGNNT